MLTEVIHRFLIQNEIPETASFLLGVSGGADSIAMAHAFRKMGLKIYALHCNFNLRGKEASTDEQFVKRFCFQWGIEMSVKKFDTRGYARDNKISVEMAARDLRYAWFEEMRKTKKMDYIAVAHHADDQVETLFLNLSRGTGIRGLCGMRDVNGVVVRPLLSVSHADILKYIEDNQLGYRFDSTNASTEFTRNRIRLQVVPVFKEINPAFLETMKANIERFTESECIFRYGIDQLKAKVVTEKNQNLQINIDGVLASPAPHTLLYEILKPYGFNLPQIESILRTSDASSGKQFLTEGYRLVRERDHWSLSPITENIISSIVIPQPGTYPQETKSYTIATFPRTDDFTIPQEAHMAALDADKIAWPLTIRTWQPGDTFCPLGMKRSRKKLSDLFTDLKFTSKEKEACRVWTSGKEIIWVENYRIDDRYKISSLTRNILLIEVTR